MGDTSPHTMNWTPAMAQEVCGQGSPRLAAALPMGIRTQQQPGKLRTLYLHARRSPLAPQP